MYGIGERGGFVQLTGEIGTGKTTLCRSLLEQVPENVRIALILNPKQSATELVASICDELNASYPPGTESLKVLIDLLNERLLANHAEGLRTVLIVDEAQNLSMDSLEQVRLLTNLETKTDKLLQILLIGQPELRTLLARPELLQLGQRITARYHLTPLSFKDTVKYICYRLEVVGCTQQLFTKPAFRAVHFFSDGIPRLINTICDRAMLGAYAKQVDRINWRLVRQAADEVLGKAEGRRRWRTAEWAVAILVLAVLISVFKFGYWPINKEWLPGVKGEPPETAAVAGDIPAIGNADPASSVNNSMPNVFAALLEREETKTDPETAFSTLFKYWHLEYDALEGDNVCERAESVGLRCVIGKGTWTSLVHSNRPAVLELVDKVQRRRHVVVAGIKQDVVVLDFGGKLETLSRADVESFWFGDYMFLWKPPLLSSTLLQQGSKGPDVVWLREQLDRLEDVEAQPEGRNRVPLFDEAREKRVKKFQRMWGIMADGKVGEETLMHLNTALADPSTPILLQNS